ncbi:MAG TPA: hypothetical protein VHU82_07940, partial [Vicinamibacterales bacterium]|nr:hypothetical protein [Vicinamibacterales bacterium]
NSTAVLALGTNNVLSNQPFLDTVYNGVDITANKRFSHHWQMVAGLTFGKNTGGLNQSSGTGTGQSTTTDLNDPNLTAYANGIVGYDSPVAFRLSGSYQAPYALTIAGTLISNSGYPYVSTYSMTRAQFATLCTANCGTGLVRSSQTVFLSDRGDERLPTTTLLDLRLSRPFNFGQGRKIVPEIDLFNVTNRYTPTSVNTVVGGTYLQPSGIISPRIIRVGFSLDF